MSTYYYKAKNKARKQTEGQLDAISADAAAEVLLSNKLAVIEISEEISDYRLFLKNISFLNKIGSKELVVFFRQLSVMIDANIPLVRSLRILSKQSKSENFSGIITEVASDVDGGASLSSSLAMFPDVFTDFYVNIIKSGETSGRLGEVMNYVAEQKEKDYDLEAKIKGAMIYPAFIVSVLAIVGFIIVAFVIPNLAKVLAESGAQLPLVTRLLLGFADFVSFFWWLIILLVAAAVIGWTVFLRTDVGRYFSDSLKIRLPIFGKIWQYIYIVRICRSFATLIRGGVPIAQGLAVVKDVVDNKVYEGVLDKTIKSVNEGNQISETFADNPYVPSIVAQMIAVGEDSGKLDEVLEKSADFYSREIDNIVRNMSNLIEPIIMIVLGLAVGLFVAAVILPMWQLSASF